MFQKIAFLLASVILVASCQSPEKSKKKILPSFSSLSEEQRRLPEFALAGMSTAEGLEVELFASEPLITNPTNISVDEKGRVWACEAYNYDVSPELEDKKGDRIVILEDTDKDGKADKRTVFYQGEDVNTALGIMVLGNKVYVSRSPNVLVFSDNDGDGIADTKDTLFTGMGDKGDHSAHAMIPGPDGKFYLALGNYSKEVRDKKGNIVVDKSGRKVSHSENIYRAGMVLKFNPDGGDVEVIGHNFRNNYEPTVDSYGNVWQSDNDDDGNKACRINYVMEYGNYGYSDEMTGAAWSVNRVGMENDIPSKHWHQNDPGVIPNLLITGAGSPAGMAFYEGNLLPEGYHNAMIHTEPLTNEVRAYIPKKNGAGFTASIKEILKSEDQWFRPVDVSVAPDGSLFVADWYDPILGGGAAGDAAKGRIYRIAPDVFTYKVPSVELTTAEGAIEALKSPNVETRFIAGQKLSAEGKNAEEALKAMWSSENPVLKARALWQLSNINLDKYIREALNDKNPEIRITAIRIAAQKAPNVLDYLKIISKDSDPSVRRQAAIALRYTNSSYAASLWSDLAEQYNGKDRWYLEALGIGQDLNSDLFFENWISKGEVELSNASKADIVWRSRASKALPLLAELIKNSPDLITTQRYFRAFDFHSNVEKEEVLASLVGLPIPMGKEVSLLALQQMDGSKVKMTPSLKNSLEEALKDAKGTMAFVNLVEKFNLVNKKEDLLEIVVKNGENDLGISAASLLLKLNQEKVLEKGTKMNDDASVAVLQSIKSIGSEQALRIIKPVINDNDRSIIVRKAAVKALGTSWIGEEWLLELVKKPNFSEELKPVAGGVLFNVYRSSLQREAAKYLPKPSSHGENLPSIKELITFNGNISSGKAVFSRTCTACHQINKEGIQFGPDLSQIGSKLSKEGLYTAIIHPDDGISHGFEGYQMQLKDGNFLMGIIKSETESSLEILQMGGVQAKVEKSKMKTKEKMSTSLMPSLVAAMKKEELIDLVEYLSSLK